ncbi:hypothetical protein F4782DRAFT_536756 [Xylaria castorea]|nr:hypothetical protein F4782DRAFT_536756 [Xylaria castorea]
MYAILTDYIRYTRDSLFQIKPSRPCRQLQFTMRQFIRKLRKDIELRGLEPASKVKEEGVVPSPSIDNGKPSEGIRDEHFRIPSVAASAQGAVFASKQTRGLRVLKEPEEPGDIEIIFIHGLTGDSYRTWLHPSGIYWPRDLLPDDIPGARILSFGYDADVAKIAGGVGQGSLRNHASTLVAEYAALQVGTSERPKRLILIAHSLGGLVAKKALIVSAESAYDEHRALDQHIVGLLFIGTPHRGSDLAGYATTMARVLKLTGKRVNDVIVSVLRPDSEVLADVQESFGMWMVRNQSRCSLACFYEEHELPGVGMVVPKKSAILEGCILLPIPSNHRDMARFSSRNAIGYARILGQIKSITSTKDSLNETENSQTSHTNDAFEIWTRWLRILAFPEMNSRENSIPAAAADTCAWILKHPKFQRWVTTAEAQILWILGHPGTGKSTLIKYVSQWPPYQSSKEGSKSLFITSFYFYNLGAQLHRTANGLLRSVLFQLLKEFPNCLESFKEHQIQLDIDAKDEQVLGGLNLLNLLENTLRNALEVTPVWLFIDALDECRNEMGDPDDETEEVRGLIRDLTNLQKVLGSSTHHLRICCSCRHYPNIAFKDDELKIFTEMENVADIKAFVERELQEGIAEAETEVTVRLQTAIAQNALGSFQWTKLVTSKALSMYRAGKSTTQIIRQIQTAPRQLSTLYHNILKSMPQEDRARSLQLFQWACFSREPLNTAQLRVLMNVQLEPEAQSYSSLEEHPDFIESEVQMERLVQSLSGGLAILQDSYIHRQSSTSSSLSSSIQSISTATTSDIWPQQLYLVHQSVKDYLLDKGLAFLDGSNKSKESLTSDAHLCIAFTYAMLCTMTDVTAGLRRIESSYDANKLLDVVRFGALNHEVQAQFFNLMYNRRMRNYRPWFEGIDIHDMRAVAHRVAQTLALYMEAEEECHSSLKSTGIWGLERHSFYHVGEAIIYHGVDIQEKLLRSLRPRLVISSGFLLLRALGHAVALDLPMICSSILECINDTDGWYYWCTLTDAAYYGGIKSIKELLKRQVPGTLEHCRALRTAVICGQLTAAELLLQAGFDPNRIERIERIYGLRVPSTILGIAASGGNKDMCSLLLRYGASVNLVAPDGWTPLMHAVGHGGESVCELLTSHSACIGARDAYGRSILDHCRNPGIRRWLVESAVTHHSRPSIATPTLSFPDDMFAMYERGLLVIKTRMNGKNTLKTRQPDHTVSLYIFNFEWSRLKPTVATLLRRKGAVLECPSIRCLSALNWAVGAGWQPDYKIVKAILSQPRNFLDRAVDEAGRTSLDWALDYYAYIRAELGPRHPTTREDVIWLEPPYHPQYNMEPPLKLTPSKAARAYEESRLIVRTLRGIGVLCRECAQEIELQVAHVSATISRIKLEAVERAPQQLE